MYCFLVDQDNYKPCLRLEKRGICFYVMLVTNGLNGPTKCNISYRNIYLDHAIVTISSTLVSYVSFNCFMKFYVNWTKQSSKLIQSNSKSSIT